MKKSKVSKIMLIIAMVAIVCCISNINYATSNLNEIIGGGTDNIESIPDLPGEGSTTPTPQPDEGNNTPNDIQSIGQVPTGNNTSNITGNTKLPAAGANDTLLFGLIAISAIAAIYTYKKVRDYSA